MKTRKLILPAVIIFAGVFVTALLAVVLNVAKKPVVTEREFPYSITYEYAGETETLEGTYVCRFSSVYALWGEQYRFWNGYIAELGEENESRYYIIDTVEDGKLAIRTNIFAGYVMGDPLYDDYYENDTEYRPYAVFYDSQSVEHTDEKLLDQYGLKIISWEYPEKIENYFVFSHVTGLSGDLVFPMAFCALVFLVLAVIFVRKEKSLTYKAIDKVSVAMNLVMGLCVLPVLAFVCMLVDVNSAGSWPLIYKIVYCIPAAQVLCITASICLRRLGFRVSGFVVQFAGPVAFAVCIVVEKLLSIFVG